MPPERYPPDDPREWLNRARSNLARAGAQIPGVYLEDLCFDAQQAAEKAIKAVLIRRKAAFPYVHDLAELVSLVEASGEAVPQSVRQAGRLTRFAIAHRYPGVIEPATPQEHREALAIADGVVRWAEERIRDG